MGLELEDILELMDRYNYLIEKYVNLAIEIAPKLEEFGRHRKEIELLNSEFSRRGIEAETKEELEKKLREEINKRNNNDQIDS